MAEEYFDVVDEQDRVVGRRSRADIHRLGLRHRAAHVLVFNAGGELFLQRRSLAKECAPGLWDSSAAGHLDSGEDYEACARRELEEELGLVAEGPLEPLFRLPACPETGQEFVQVFRCRGEGPLRLHPEEILEGRWCSPRIIDAWMAARPGDFSGSLRLIWPRLRHPGAFLS